MSDCLRFRVSWSFLVATCALGFGGCSSESGGAGTTNPALGGARATGGNGGVSTGGLATGGQGQGGTTSSASVTASGGASLLLTGGTKSTSGGTKSTGGATGGTKSSGSATGGTTSTGGTGVVAGGTKTSGGTTSTGGAIATGGTTASAGGTKTTAGTTSTGGSLSTGGTTAAAGTASTGGTGSTGGSTGTGTSTLSAITATQAASGMGKGFDLGQTFESTQNERTLAAITPKIDAYYAKGFRNVRIPITWTEAIGGDLLVNSATVGDVNRTHARLAVIKQVVDYALSKSGMYVIINAHHEVALKTNSRATVLERLWADIADIFSAKDHRLLFEILNEPHRSDSSAMPAADLRKMTGMAYAKIRAVDPARIILIGGNQWFAANEMQAVWTDLTEVGDGKDTYLMATFHHYDPWTFCGDNQGTYDDPWTDSNISTPMDTMLSWAKSVGKGMPVHIGEWGVAWQSKYSTMDCNNIRSWYQKFHSQNASPKGIPTTLWDDNGWFKVFDLGSNSWNNNLADCISGTCDWNGTERFNAGCK